MVTKPYQDFEDKVVELGKRAGYRNKSRIADAAKISRAAMSKLSVRRSGVIVIYKLADTLGVTPAELVEGTSIKPEYTTEELAGSVDDLPEDRTSVREHPYSDFVDKLMDIGRRVGFESGQQISMTAKLGRNTVTNWRAYKPLPDRLAAIAHVLGQRPLELVQGTSLEGQYKESDFDSVLQSEPDKYDIGLAISAGTKLYFDGRQLSVEEVTKLRQMLSK